MHVLRLAGKGLAEQMEAPWGKRKKASALCYQLHRHESMFCSAIKYGDLGYNTVSFHFLFVAKMKLTAARIVLFGSHMPGTFILTCSIQSSLVVPSGAALAVRRHLPLLCTFWALLFLGLDVLPCVLCVYCFYGRNSRQTLSSEFNNRRETTWVPAANYLRFCTV